MISKPSLKIKGVGVQVQDDRAVEENQRQSMQVISP